jgi:hypothetical protein
VNAIEELSRTPSWLVPVRPVPPNAVATARNHGYAGDVTAVPARLAVRILCCVKQPRYSHALNTQRVRNRVGAPLSITNKSRKCLILGPRREIRSRSVSSGEPLSSSSRTSPGRRLTQPLHAALRALALSSLNSAQLR